MYALCLSLCHDLVSTQELFDNCFNFLCPGNSESPTCTTALLFHSNTMNHCLPVSSGNRVPKPKWRASVGYRVPEPEIVGFRIALDYKMRSKTSKGRLLFGSEKCSHLGSNSGHKGTFYVQEYLVKIQRM